MLYKRQIKNCKNQKYISTYVSVSLYIYSVILASKMYKLMHKVRAYTFDFCSFLSVAYTTLNKLFAFFIYYICGFTKEFIASGSFASNAIPYCWSLCQIWRESIQNCRSYGRLTDFKMAAAAISDFCTMLFLAVNLSARPCFQPMFQIQCKCVQ